MFSRKKPEEAKKEPQPPPEVQAPLQRSASQTSVSDTSSDAPPPLPQRPANDEVLLQHWRLLTLLWTLQKTAQRTTLPSNN
jgi:hypothetical protein